MFTKNISKIVAVLLVLGVVFVSASFATRSASVSRVYDGVEQLRASRSFTVAPNTANYDQIENIRGQRALSLITDSYSAIEQVRNPRSFSADRSYDLIEQLRLQP